MQIAPPTASLRQSEIDKDAVAGPHFGNEELTTLASLKIVSRYSLIENVVALIRRFNLRLRRIDWLRIRRRRLILHAGIDNYDCLDALLRELFRKAFGIGKPDWIEREHAVTVHVMNVEIDYVQRKITFAILPHHLLDHGLRIVTVATLLTAERPQRRKWNMAGQVSIATENLFDRWAIQKVVIQLPAFGAKPYALLRKPAEIEIAAITIIKKDSVSRTFLQTQIERNGLINRILAFVVTRRVGVPVHEGTPPFVEVRRLLTKTVEVFVETQLLRGGHKYARRRIKQHPSQCSLPVIGHRLVVGIDYFMRTGIAEINEQG